MNNCDDHVEWNSFQEKLTRDENEYSTCLFSAFLFFFINIPYGFSRRTEYNLILSLSVCCFSEYLSIGCIKLM